MRRFFKSVGKKIKSITLQAARGIKKGTIFIFDWLKPLRILVAMQLKEKLNLKDTKIKSIKTLFKSIFGILKFALVVAMCWLAFYLCQRLKLFSLTIILPTSVIAIVFTIMIAISTITATMGLTKSMYYSYDNPVLLTLPCRATQVYVSKLIVFYIFELIRNLSFMVPLFIAFGIINGAALIYYPWIFICFIFISLIPVLLGAILSIPMMWFYNFFRQYKRLQFISLVILVALITYIVASVINVIPANIDLIGTWGTTYWQIQDFLNNFTIKFDLFYKLTTMITGIRVGSTTKVIIFSSTSTLRFITLIGFNVLVFLIGLITVKPLFYKMASKPFEYRKNNNVKVKKNIVSNKKVSNLKTQILLSIRDAEKMFASLILMVSLPILIFFLNKLFGAMNTGSLGDNLTVAFNVLIIMLISLSSNSYAASVFSRDGRSSYLIKVQPSRYQPLLISKLFVNTVIMAISYIATLFVLIYSSGISASQSIYLMLACFGIYLAHLAYSAELDIMNPQIELYSTIGNSDSNPNETKSTLMAFLASFITAVAILMFLTESAKNMPYIKLAVIAIVIMLLRFYMLSTKIKLYYKEK